MIGQPCPEDSVAWCGSYERVLLQAFQYTYHCTNLCSQIRRADNVENIDDILFSAPFILGGMGELEKIHSHKKMTSGWAGDLLKMISDQASHYSRHVSNMST
jgi:hypothetical protein